MGKVGSELNLQGQGVLMTSRCWVGEKSRRKEIPGKHSEAGWCGVVGVVCMLKGWGDGTVGRKDYSSEADYK